MIEMTLASLAVSLVLATCAVVVLALLLPRRIASHVAQLQAAELAKEENRVAAVKASAAELAAIVQASRGLLADQANAVEAMQGLAVWATATAHAYYARTASESAAAETVRKPEAPPPVSRERSATPSAPERAAGLHGPSARSLASSSVPPRQPVRFAAKTLASMPAVPAPAASATTGEEVRLNR